jgi:LPXTG-site transpeptidase (sortase) family protein
MPEDIAYAQTSLALEIPALKLKTEIVGVPFDEKENAWAITWLYRNAGWLENTAFPTHDGNSVLTAHAFLADGTPGPFEKIGSLGSGDRLIVELQGQKYIYEVREVKRVRPFAVNTAFKHEDSSWLTLVTCQSYDDVAKEYRYRIVVRAELVSVE